MKLIYKTSLILSILISFYSCNSVTILKVDKETNVNAYPQTGEEIMALNSKIDKAYYSLLGTFNNQVQADTASSPYCKGQILRSIPIWKEQGRDHWFSMGWYSVSMPEAPIGIGIFHLEKYAIDTFQLEYYPMPANVDPNGIWTEPNFLNEVKPSDLVLKDGCSSFLVYQGNDSFNILNDNKPCSCDMASHIKYFDMNALISPHKQIHTNVFYDTNKNVSMAYPKIHYARQINLDR